MRNPRRLRVRWTFPRLRFKKIFTYDYGGNNESKNNEDRRHHLNTCDTRYDSGYACDDGKRDSGGGVQDRTCKRVQVKEDLIHRKDDSEIQQKQK